MKCPTLIAATIVASNLFAPVARAKLDLVAFDDLLKDSTLIILAHSMEAALDDSGRGHAVLKVARVVRGAYPNPTIRLVWAGHEDDQAILEVGRDYVLFLRKDTDGFAPAIHGVSYWLVSYTRDWKQVVEYVHPTRYVKMPPGVVSTVELYPAGRPDRNLGCHIEAISLDHFLNAIVSHR
jgi:hypothetical protein